MVKLASFEPGVIRYTLDIELIISHFMIDVKIKFQCIICTCVLALDVIHLKTLSHLISFN